MLSEELDRTVGQRITLRAPTVPTDVGMNVLSVKADCFQNSQRLRQYLVSDAVSRHGNNRVVPHHWLLEISTAEMPSTPRGPQTKQDCHPDPERSRRGRTSAFLGVLCVSAVNKSKSRPTASPPDSPLRRQSPATAARCPVPGT